MLHSFDALAEEANILFIGKDLQESEVELWVLNDDLTLRRTWIKTQNLIGDSTLFSLSFDRIRRIQFRVDYQFAEMYVTPGNDYKVIFTSVQDRGSLNLSGNTQVPIFFLSLPEGDINFARSKMDELLYTSIWSMQLDSISTVNPKDIQKAINKQVIIQTLDSLQKDTSWNGIENLYVLGLFELRMQTTSRKELYRNYLLNQKVYYDHPAWWSFVQAFYENFFDFYLTGPFRSKLIEAMNGSNPADQLIRIIVGDTLTGDEELQRLIMIIGAFDLYPQIELWRPRIVELLERESRENPWKQQRIVARNLISDLLREKKGSPIPNLKWRTPEMKEDSLRTGEKYTYIQFFTSWNEASEMEMELMQELQLRYPDDIRFLSLSFDTSFVDFHHFMSSHADFTWEFGWVDQPDILYQYEVYQVPLFYLADPELKIVRWPALKPSTGIESVFLKIRYNRL